MDKHSFPNGKRLVRDTLKPDDNLHYEKFSDGTVKCIEDEIPFDIPDSWVWCRLNDLALYKKGPFGSSITKAMFVPESDNVIKVYEQKNAINKSAQLGHYFISQEKYEELRGFEVFPGDIIVSCAGTIGETFVMPHDMRKGIINQALMKIHLFDSSVKAFYLMYFDNKLKTLANEQGYGMALKNIPPFSILKRYLIPIPPKAEQERILDHIKIILSNINDIDLLAGKLKNDVANAKSKILDLAIRGKLVPQDPNDEPASVLLERIRAEKEELIKQGKIKRDKKESVIFKGDDNSYYEKIGDDVTCIDDEILFDIPPTWNWCRLGTIGDWAAGATPNRKNSEYFIGNIPWLKTGDLNDNYITYIPEHISEKALQHSSLRLNPTGSVLIAMYGATIGKLGILTFPATTNQACCACLPFDGIDNKYLFYYLMSQKSNFIYRGVGGAQSNISKEKIISTLFPLPPKEEQHMIVNQIEKLMKLIQQFEELL